MIHALPGMGADHRMFQGPWQSLPDFNAHDWPTYRGEKTLTDVARSVCDEWNIRDDDVLIGSSLGGMVACEITKLRNIRKLFLVGSAIDRKEVSYLWSMLRPLVWLTPIEVLKFAASKIHRDLFQMFAASDTLFIRNMCDAIFKWEGVGSTSSTVYRIHGIHDRIIPLPDKVDLALNAGHLIAMTHAAECVAYVLFYLERI